MPTSTTTATGPKVSNVYMDLLSQLLVPRVGQPAAPVQDSVAQQILSLTREQFAEFVELANSNHVIIRGLDAVLDITRGRDDQRTEWAMTALAEERARIQNAIPFLHRICSAFDQKGYDVTVIKSLDHWPDIGSDLDLYTNTDSDKVIELMRSQFQAELADRSWGDRLARKWNFENPGLPEAVEIHMGRLGQTGEQVSIASTLTSRVRQVTVDGLQFRVPAISDRLLISTLQRMYRHFYFRLCDILDSAELVEQNLIDYADLKTVAQRAGIWEGVATYLVIVSDYVKKYRGTPLALPTSVTATARFGGDLVYYAKEFIRVPIMPHSAGLYSSQMSKLLRKGEVSNSARLGLLPALATAALVGLKITGSDKGIW